MDFTSLSWLLQFPAAERIYCKGKSTNNRVAWALTVSKMLFRELQLNLSAPRCHKDRADVFTEIFLEEKSRGHTLPSLTNARWVSQSKHIVHGKKLSVIYVIALKRGADLFAVTMFVEPGAARLTPTVACWMCVKLQTRCLLACINSVLYLSRVPSKNQLAQA